MEHGWAICTSTRITGRQGETLDDLKDHLRALYTDLTSGDLPALSI